MSNHHLSDEEKALFRDAVNKLKNTHPSKHTGPSALDLCLSDTTSTDLKAETPICYTRTSLPSKRLRALKKGHYPIEGRLDLHGLTVSEAKTAFLSFIPHQQAQQHRVFLLIHGKGGVTPILKNHIHHWLPQCPQVLAFVSALPKDGGMGAVYVLLRQEGAPKHP